MSRSAATRTALRTYGPPLAWFALIFVLTSIPSTYLPQLPWRYVDKILHFAIYLPFGLLLTRAPRSLGPKQLLLVLGVCLAVAFCDELHQLMVPGRQADVIDFSADVAGAGLGVLLGMALRKGWRPWPARQRTASSPGAARPR